MRVICKCAFLTAIFLAGCASSMYQLYLWERPQHEPSQKIYVHNPYYWIEDIKKMSPEEQRRIKRAAIKAGNDIEKEQKGLPSFSLPGSSYKGMRWY